MVDWLRAVKRKKIAIEVFDKEKGLRMFDVVSYKGDKDPGKKNFYLFLEKLMNSKIFCFISRTQKSFDVDALEKSIVMTNKAIENCLTLTYAPDPVRMVIKENRYGLTHADVTQKVKDMVFNKEDLNKGKLVAIPSNNLNLKSIFI
jgi:hypothetical protein